jgi:hypothetical protein
MTVLSSGMYLDPAGAEERPEEAYCGWTPRDRDRLGSVGLVTRNVTRNVVGSENEEPRDTEVSTGEDLPEWARRDSNARPLAPEASALSN